MSIRPLAEADASCGAKAFGLARLIAAGLPVPQGFVLDAAMFREAAALGLTEGQPDAIGHELAAAAQRIAEAAPPAELDRELRAISHALGRLAVRSSASIEDGELGAAAGVFASVTDVAPGEVWNAIRAVWTGALTPLAVAYAQRRGASISIAVILQRFVPGPRVTIYTRPVGGEASDELWLQRGDALERIGRSAAGPPEAEIALAAEAAIGASRGADVELVLEPTPQGARPWIVQARPILHPVRQRRRGPPPILLAPLVQDGRRWTWDIAHNPDPLSPAQAGVVERVDRAGTGDDWLPYSLRVCGGYLYTAPRAAQKPPAPPTDRAELAERIAAIEARLAPLVTAGEGAALTVADALERYVPFVQIWTCELSPLVAAARKRLLDRLARDGHAPERIPALAAQLIGPRRVLRDPVMSPAWDIAVPTFAERPPARVEQRSDLAPGGTTVEPIALRAEFAVEVDLARAAADAGELDDLWFARAQWLVRRALLAHATALALRGDDIFWLPLDEVITLRTLDPDDAHRRASAARAAHARAAEWDMPLIVHGDASTGEEAADAQLHGVGEGPRVVGRVRRLALVHTEAANGGASGRAIGHDDIVVTRAITPALAMMVEGCAALVSETGGLLDHGAALARELGIPCVVGCRGAWSLLADGMLVSVDGDAGLVSRPIEE
ncbi:MAG TPA: PEP-utilizing enzyme [Kofleriaceae bacterium]|nr:PEP-utilizing enzyme [Kofleriaceae bacterium]